MARALNKNRIRDFRIASILLLALILISNTAIAQHQMWDALFEMAGSLLVGICIIGRIYTSAFIGGRKNAAVAKVGQTGFPVLVNHHAGVLVIIEAGAFQFGVFERKTQRFDQVQFTAGVGTESNNIACIRRYFRLVENNGKHRCGANIPMNQQVGQVRRKMARASTQASTCLAPLCSRVLASACRVAPVLATSSTIAM